MKQFWRIIERYYPWLLLLLGVDCFCSIILWISDIQAFQTLIGLVVLTSILLFSAILFVLNKRETTRRELFRDFLSDPAICNEERLLSAISREEGESIRLLASVLQEHKTESNSMADALQDYEEYVEGWAHEAKTPLSLLTMLLDNRSNEMSPPLQAKLDYVRSQLQEDVTQMLYYARLKSSTKDYQFEDINLNQCLGEVLEDYAPLLEEKQFVILNKLQSETVYTDRRGLIEMISYHFLWDLVYLYNADIPWYKSHGAYIWQQSICWTFILLAGFSWHLGKKHMKRGLWAFGGGVVVSLVTAIVLPNDRVRYGVLTLIGSCILIWILLDKVLKKIPAGVGVSVSFVLFLILRSWTKQDPIQLSDNLLNVTWLKSVLAYIGFPQAGFSSTDYFPLLPWIFLFATGYFLYSFLQEKGLINRLFGKWKVPGINFLGKHSLIIYMIHQPICYVVAFLVSEIF